MHLGGIGFEPVYLAAGGHESLLFHFWKALLQSAEASSQLINGLLCALRTLLGSFSLVPRLLGLELRLQQARAVGSQHLLHLVRIDFQPVHLAASSYEGLL